MCHAAMSSQGSAMIPIIEIAKLSGSGNDFICIDNRAGLLEEVLSSPRRVGHFARTLCRRGLSVGADGVIFAIQPEIEGVADVGARFFEPDGSEAELCGNGAACFARWTIDNQWVHDSQARFLTTAGVVIGRKSDDPYYRVCIPLPENIQRNIELDVEGSRWMCDFAVAGVPHLVVTVDDVQKVDIQRLGPAFRYHPRFGPRGVNVNFTQVLGDGRLAVRTWEFGVEGETLACGTGSTAAAILSALRFNWPREFLRNQRPVMVQARSGDVLRIYFTYNDDGSMDDVCLESVVRFVYQATLHPETARRAWDPSFKG